VRIFRPSLLIAERSQSRPGEYIAQTVAPWISWMLVGPLRQYREINVETVAKAMRLDSEDPLKSQLDFKLYLSDQIESYANSVPCKL